MVYSRTQACALFLALFGISLLIITIVGRSPLAHYINGLIKQKVLILPGTDTYDNWKESPVPIYDNLFLFNITNPHGFNHGEKAVLKLVGPFVYRKYQIKKQSNFTGDLQFAKYYDYTRFIFDESETQKYNKLTTLEDRIFIPNVPLITVSSQIAHNTELTDFLRNLFEKLLEEYEEAEGVNYLTLNGTVEEILWGMDDPIMELLYKYKLAPSPKLALQTNGSSDPAAETEPTIVFTGYTDISKIDEYNTYHGRNSSGCWGSEAANRINGTEGSMFEPLVMYNKSRPVSIYNEQLYRSVDLNYVNESKYGGIPCYDYKIPGWALENKENNPINEAYYAYIYSGMLNVTKCLSNVPLFVTKAMFLDADERLRDNITLSINANRTLHDTYLCVEPYTGVVVDGHKRVQINVQIEHEAFDGFLNNTRPAFIPLIYVDEHGSITPELAAKLNKSLLVPILISHIAFYVLCTLGALIFCVSVFLHARIIRNKNRNKSEDSQLLVNPEEDYKENLLDESQEDPDRTSEASDQFLSFDGKTSRYFEASG